MSFFFKTPLCNSTIMQVLMINRSTDMSNNSASEPTKNSLQTGYALVNGLHMYYEIHGTGEPLIVLHGAYMSIVTMGEIVPRLAQTRQVIAVELQGHGRTADIDRPLSYEQMADDVAALMREIGVEKADIFGYSMGGGVALQLAIRHPEVVRKLVVASATYTSRSLHPGMMEMLETITPDVFAGSPWEADYLRLAPNPENFSTLVRKLTQFDSEVQDWPRESIQALSTPTMIIMGDADIIQPEYAVDLLRLRGGGINGDLEGVPNARLAILPGTTHLGVISRVDWITPMIVEFLDAPAPTAL
jgi:pimeloyl-ACP methyl ester carboxylesterase